MSADSVLAGVRRFRLPRYAWLTLWVSALFIVLRVFVFEVHHVSGNSMKSAILNGDVVLVSKLSYGPRLPRDIFEVPLVNIFAYLVVPARVIKRTIDSRGAYRRLTSFSGIARNDIVIFNQPPYQDHYFIKRCVGIPNDTVVAGQGDVRINIFPVDWDRSAIRAYIIPGEKNGLSPGSPVFNQIKLYRSYFGENELVRNDVVLAGRIPLDHDYFFLTGDNKAVSTDSRTMGLIQDDHIVGKVTYILYSIDENESFFSCIRWSRIFKKAE